jgi:hypothetical protein
LSELKYYHDYFQFNEYEEYNILHPYPSLPCSVIRHGSGPPQAKACGGKGSKIMSAMMSHNRNPNVVRGEASAVGAMGDDDYERLPHG